MSDMRFEIVGANAARNAATPTIIFDLVITTPSPALHNLALNCQIRIEPEKRRYSVAEGLGLDDLFGPAARWGETLRPFPWAQIAYMVPAFTHETRVALAVPCTYDFEVAASKYLHALKDGEVPLRFFFSGTIFGTGDRGLEVTRVPWDREATFRLPVRVWREMMDAFFPNSGWLRLRRETLDSLLHFKAKKSLATWDEVIDELLLADRQRRAS